MIPQVCNFYWGGGKLSFLQYLSVVSFKKHNPDWQINLFMPKDIEEVMPTWITNEQTDVYTGKDYLEKAKKLCTVIEIDFTEHALAKPRHEVQKADIIRWYILYEYGGVWSDIDILYIKPVPVTEGVDAVICYHLDPYIGFLTSRPHQDLFQFLYLTSKDNIRRNMDDTYQALGAELLRNRFDNFQSVQSSYPQMQLLNLPMDVVYPYLPNEDIKEMLYGIADKVKTDTIGLHWYNGSPIAKKYQNDFKQASQNNSIISQLAREYV